jgi:hypothetical protein
MMMMIFCVDMIISGELSDQQHEVYHHQHQQHALDINIHVIIIMKVAVRSPVLFEHLQILLIR